VHDSAICCDQVASGIIADLLLRALIQTLSMKSTSRTFGVADAAASHRHRARQIGGAATVNGSTASDAAGLTGQPEIVRSETHCHGAAMDHH
jgi:hypothetical protein